MGEHFTCPVCGETAEVYSRITGYYRPVQNWNDGKIQEYNNRTVYNPIQSALKTGGNYKISNETIQNSTESSEGHAVYLFITNTCPNCSIAKEMLEGEEYEIIDAESNPVLVQKYGIKQAPTLVVVDGGNTTKYVNASNIQRYMDTHS